MVNISYEAYCCLSHWGLSKWTNEGENTRVDSTDQSPLVHRPQEGTRQYLTMMKTTFSGQRCSEQRPKKDDIWRPRINLENLSNGTACSRTQFKDAKKLGAKPPQMILYSPKRKRWLSQFTHNLPCCVKRSQKTPAPKASETQSWEIFLPDLMPTRAATSHNKSDAVPDYSHLCRLKALPQTEVTFNCSMEKQYCAFLPPKCNKYVPNSIMKLLTACCLKTSGKTEVIVLN